MSVGNITRFTEATRVQMPGLVHLTRLGYTYYGKLYEDMAGKKYDPDTNILLEVFKEQFCKLNPGREGEVDETLRMIRQELDNDDLGRGFYKRLTSVSPVKLVDFDEPKNNVYHCTAEFTCKRDQDEFRPDITIFVNGLPLVFIEVKKPNNRGGMVEESMRMNRQRFPNKKFRRFINITQFMIFSNNMEYDTLGGIVPVQGAFYCTAAREFVPFNCFREENMGKVKNKALEEIVSIDAFDNIEEFEQMARAYKSPRTFITLKSERVERIKNKTKRKKVASMLKIEVNDDGKFVFKNDEEVSLLLRYLCFKVFKDDETKELLEANNVTQLSL